MNADLDWFEFARDNQTYLRRLLTIPPSRPSPLVRAGKIAIRVGSITLHCQKYYLPGWRGEFERVILS